MCLVKRCDTAQWPCYQQNHVTKAFLAAWATQCLPTHGHSQVTEQSLALVICSCGYNGLVDDLTLTLIMLFFLTLMLNLCCP